MKYFSWIFLGLTGLLLLASAICWVVFLLMDDPDWRRLGVKTFRLAMVPLLLLVNVVIYGHIVDTLS
ncbi:MAG: hypothetical protein RLZZ618_1815 [Pseudomonadota bacterium]|jgi:hypothetical protein